MGPTMVLVNAVLTAVLLAISGYAPWALGVAGVLWAAAIGVAAKYGHRNFGTGANSDLFIVVTGLGITAAIAVPKYAEHQPCERASRVAWKIAAAQGEWKKTHPAYATELSELGLKLDPSVTVNLAAEENDFVVTATHPGCADPAVSTSGF